MTQPQDPVQPQRDAAPPTEVFAPPTASGTPAPVGPPPLNSPPAMQGYGQQPAGYGTPGPIGKVRGTGMAILLFIVTFGIYGLVWYYSVHDEMKRHRGTGLGGGLALVLSIFVGFVMPYITSSEVGGLYQARGQHQPVSGVTGLWYFPGYFLIVGPIVWFVKTNGALNDYWRSVGAA